MSQSTSEFFVGVNVSIFILEMNTIVHILMFVIGINDFRLLVGSVTLIILIYNRPLLFTFRFYESISWDVSKRFTGISSFCHSLKEQKLLFWFMKG